MTGTDSRPVSAPSATPGATLAIADACNTNADNTVASIGPRTSNPKVVGSNPTGRTWHNCGDDLDRGAKRAAQLF